MTAPAQVFARWRPLEPRQPGPAVQADRLDPAARVEAAVAALARGEPVVLLDDPERENEADLILAADTATPEWVAFMVRHTSGLICVGLPGSRLDALELPMMVPGAMGTAFTVSVDARRGTTTGISAADRAATIRVLADRRTRPDDLSRPGHVFPLRARGGGTLDRAGHTEAAVDLTGLAGLEPAGALCELVNDDGSMARPGDAERFARLHGLALVSIEELIAYRLRTENLVQPLAAPRIPTAHGDFRALAYRSSVDGAEHVAMVKGEVAGAEDLLVRVHSECLPGEAFGSLRCDCGPQLDMALARIAEEGSGVVVYLRGHEGWGIGLGPKLQAYRLQDQGRDTVEANGDMGFPPDCRQYGLAAQILADIGVRSVRLLTNNPRKVQGLTAAGTVVRERVPLVAPPRPGPRAWGISAQSSTSWDTSWGSPQRTSAKRSPM